VVKYLIVGNGVAGTAAAEHIRKIDSEGSITILTDEGLPFYSRIRLNEYMSGDITDEDLIIKKDSWYEDNRIKLLFNTRVTGADLDKQVVIANNNNSFSYDRLLVATGSHSFVPPIKGVDQTGVFCLRNIQDARNIMAYAENIDNIVIIGGGLLGLESGNALLKAGKKITVVEFFPRLLPRQLDDSGASRLQSIMEEMGFSFELGTGTKEIKGQGTAEGLLLDNGESLTAEMIIISAGVRPNMELVEPLGLEYDKGILVDEYMKTNRADIYAAGDGIQYKEFSYGIWPASMEHGKIAGINMAGGDTQYQGTAMSNTLKVAGINLASAGNIDVDNVFESKMVSDDNTYKKIVFDNDIIIGCIMLGDKKGFNKITKLISEKTDVSGIRDIILSDSFDFSSI
jgi:nitrite reductase (NADH) large subunit